MLLALALAAAQPPAEPMTAEVVRDALTDRVTATATLRADYDRLVIGCDPYRVRRPWVRFDARRWFRPGNPFNGNLSLAYRFDAQPSHRMMWSVRETSALLVGIDRVRRFIGALAGSERLVIRARDIENRSFDTVFEVVDAGPAIARVLEACGETARR